MSLRAGKVNPLNVLDIRKVPFPAHHFQYTLIHKYSPTTVRHLDEWIFQNLNGRYYIGQAIDLVDNSIIFVTKIGFEQEKELSYFKLAGPLPPL